LNFSLKIPKFISLPYDYGFQKGSKYQYFSLSSIDIDIQNYNRLFSVKNRLERMWKIGNKYGLRI